MTYEEFKTGIGTLAVEQEKTNRICVVKGSRHRIPLEGREIEIILYMEKADAPVLFCAFGGGFVFGGCALDDELWYTLHQKLGVTLISIGYRRAPEYPYPTAIHDVYDTIAYVCEHRGDFGIESEDYSVYGNSAGGNLMTSVCMLNLARGGKLNIRRQILNYPYCDVDTSPEDKGHPQGQLYMYQMFIDYYCKEEERRNPQVSPVFAKTENLKGMPRAIISLADNDALHAEGARYICKLRAAGVKVDAHMAPKMYHGYSETFFQGDNEYLNPEEREYLYDGTMEKCVYETIDFIKEHF